MLSSFEDNLDDLRSSFDQSKPYTNTKKDDIGNMPLFPLNLKDFTRVLIILLKSGLPTSLGLLWSLISGLISLRFAGKYGTASELAGVTLASTWSGVFCVGILCSVTQGFGVIGSRLVGAKKYSEFGMLFQKNVFVLGIVMIPLLTPFFIADDILLWFGLDYEVSINASIYLKNVIPSVIAISVFESLRVYLIAQNLFHIQPVVQAIFTVIHAFWCYVFVAQLNMPVAGVAIAKSITDISTVGVLWLYIKFNSRFKESWIPWSRSCTENSISYLKQTLIIGSNMYAEWISIEISMFIISAMNDKYLVGAHGISMMIIGLFLMIPLGNTISMQTFIGNAVGEGSKNKAQKFLAAGLAMNFMITLPNVLILLLFNNDISEFFTDDEKVKETLQTILFIYTFGNIADSLVVHLTAVLKTIGKEKQVFTFFCIFYLAIAVNCEWVFGLVLGYGFAAVWISMAMGMYLMSGWAIWETINLDWDSEIARIQLNVNNIKTKDNSIYLEMTEK